MGLTLLPTVTTVTSQVAHMGLGTAMVVSGASSAAKVPTEKSFRRNLPRMSRKYVTLCVTCVCNAADREELQTRALFTTLGTHVRT